MNESRQRQLAGVISEAFTPSKDMEAMAKKLKGYQGWENPDKDTIMFIWDNERASMSFKRQIKKDGLYDADTGLRSKKKTGIKLEYDYYTKVYKA